MTVAPAPAGAAPVLQSGIDVTIDPLFGAVGGAVGAFVTTVVVGAILRGVAADYTDARMADLRSEPVGSFLYGIACLLFALLATFVLVLTIVGILVAIPLLIAAYLVWAVGSAVAFLAIADGIVGHEDGWGVALLVAGALSGGLTVTGVGGIVAFGVGAAGFGAVLRDYIE